MTSQENYFALFAASSGLGRKRSISAAAPTPPTPPSRHVDPNCPPKAACAAPSAAACVVDSDSDQDELLLGCAKRQPQPTAEVDIPSSNTASPTSESALAKPHRGGPYREIRFDTIYAVSTPAGREKAAERAHLLLLTALRDDPNLMEAFEPFMTSKAIKSVHRLEEGLTCEALPMPAVMANATGDFTLRSYQLDGVRFMLHNMQRGLNTILADDMGLGKTAQVCSLLSLVRRCGGGCGPHLVVTPLSTVGGWIRELTSWAPLLRVHKYHGKDRHTLREVKSGVFVVTPATLHLDRAFFIKRVWQCIIVDEAHGLKNNETSASVTMARVQGAFRLAMTGTPVSNSPAEVWALMRFLYPRFGRQLDGPSAQDDWRDLADSCTAVLRYVMLRRTKGSLDLGLPPRIDLPLKALPPTGVEKALYASVLTNASDLRSRAGLASLLVNLRRVFCHPLVFRLHATKEALLDWSPYESPGLRRLRDAGIPLDEETIIAPSSKMQYLDKLLSSLDVLTDKVLIFSNYTSQLDVLEGYCHLRGYALDRLDGETTVCERELLMKRFNHPKCRIFVLLISTTAGGVGITLTGANHVVIYDPHFNPQMDRQAADRAHRIGQTRPVKVHRMVLSDTVEERILERARLRTAASDTITDGVDGDVVSMEESGFGRILEEEQRHLFVDPAHRVEVDAILSYYQPRSFIATGGSKPSKVTAPIDTPTEVEETTFGNCFACGEDGHTVKCPLCSKRYHLGCDTWETTRVKQQWRCTRHSCHECGTHLKSVDPLFLCTTCPWSSCFDCFDATDATNMALSPDGVSFPGLSQVYDDAEKDGFVPRRNFYFTTCRRCAKGNITDDDDGVEESGTEADTASDSTMSVTVIE